jgi:hypothetical protein
MQERSEPLITKTEELLRIFQLKKQDLTDANIEISDFERAIDPTFLGKSLHFLVKVSFARSLFLWPLLSTKNIKINSEEKTKQACLVKNRKDRSSVGLNSDAWYLSSDTEDEDAQKGSTHLSLTRDKNDEEDNDDLLEKQETHSTHVLTSSALLLGSENALKGVSRVSAFLDTSDSLLNGVWNAFLTSLIINGLVNYLLYPKEREPTDLVDAFGITGLRNILCIRSIETIRNSFLCSPNYQKGYDDILSSSLSSYYIWPFIAGTPLIFGAINAIHASWNMKKLDKQDIKVLIQQLREYEPGFWADGLGWLFTAAIPDLLPPVAILFILPQPTIKQALEKIRHSIIWDGRLSAKDRKKLFDELREFAEQRSQFTQMKALSMLADIVEGINFKNLTLMTEEGVDGETIKTLIIIKAQALKDLVFLANHYNLPEEPYSKFKPLFRYLYANYLIWNLGYPQQAFLQPLFFFSKAVKLDYSLLFLKAILGGIIEIINNYLYKKNCLEAGREWSYFEALNEFQCTDCEDFNLFARYILSTKNCVREYLDKPRSFDDIMLNIVNRDQKKNLWRISRSFNFSEVTELLLARPTGLLQPGQLAQLLNALQSKMLNLQRFKMSSSYYQNLNLADINAFGQFIKKLPITELILDELSIELIPSLTEVSSKIKIRLSFGVFGKNISYFTELAKGLRNLEVTHLQLLGVSTDSGNGMRIIASAFPGSKITWLSINMAGKYALYNACEIVAEQLPNSSIQVLELQGDTGFSSSCTEALIKGIKQIKQNFNLTLASLPPGNSGMFTLFANALSNNSLPRLKKLDFSKAIGGEGSIIALLQAFPRSSLVDVEIDFSYIRNYVAIIPQMADAIGSQSMIRHFDFMPPELKPNEVDLLSSFLPNKLRKITGLKVANYFGEYGTQRIKTLFNALRYTSIEKLYLGFAVRENTLLALFAEILPQTEIKTLDLWITGIGANDIKAFLKILDQTKIETMRLSLTGCHIGDEGLSLLFTNFQYSPVKSLSLASNNITTIGARTIIQTLTTYKSRHGLWIERINIDKQISIVPAFLVFNPKTNLTDLSLSYNAIGNEAAKALCNILPQTDIVPLKLELNNMNISQSIIDKCGIFSNVDTSNANSLRPTGPYVLLYRIYQASRQSLSTFAFNYYKMCTDYYLADFPKTNPRIIDISDLSNTETIIDSPCLLNTENSKYTELNNVEEQGCFDTSNLTQSPTADTQSIISSYIFKLFEMPLDISKSLFDSFLNALISGAADTVEQCPCYFAKDNSKFWSNNRGQSLFFNRSTSVHANANSILNLPSISSGFIGQG